MNNLFKKQRNNYNYNRKRYNNGQLNSGFTFTQEEFAQDVSFSSVNDSPSKTQLEELETIEECSDYSCDSIANLPSTKRSKWTDSFENSYENFQDDDEEDAAFEKLLQKPVDSPENVFENLKEDEGNVEFAVERRETIQIEEIKESSTISQDFERKDEKINQLDTSIFSPITSQPNNASLVASQPGIVIVDVLPTPILSGSSSQCNNSLTHPQPRSSQLTSSPLESQFIYTNINHTFPSNNSNFHTNSNTIINSNSNVSSNTSTINKIVNSNNNVYNKKNSDSNEKTNISISTNTNTHINANINNNINSNTNSNNHIRNENINKKSENKINEVENDDLDLSEVDRLFMEASEEATKRKKQNENELSQSNFSVSTPAISNSKTNPYTNSPRSSTSHSTLNVTNPYSNIKTSSSSSTTTTTTTSNNSNIRNYTSNELQYNKNKVSTSYPYTNNSNTIPNKNTSINTTTNKSIYSNMRSSINSNTNSNNHLNSSNSANNINNTIKSNNNSNININTNTNTNINKKIENKINEVENDDLDLSEVDRLFMEASEEATKRKKQNENELSQSNFSVSTPAISNSKTNPYTNSPRLGPLRPYSTPIQTQSSNDSRSYQPTPSLSQSELQKRSKTFPTHTKPNIIGSESTPTDDRDLSEQQQQSFVRNLGNSSIDRLTLPQQPTISPSVRPISTSYNSIQSIQSIQSSVSKENDTIHPVDKLNRNPQLSALKELPNNIIPTSSSSSTTITTPSCSINTSRNLTQHTSISYESIDLDDLAEIEKLEQNALSQRNNETPPSRNETLQHQENSMLRQNLLQESNDSSQMQEYICRRFIAIDVEEFVDNCILCKHILCTPILQNIQNNNNNNNQNNQNNNENNNNNNNDNNNFNNNKYNNFGNDIYSVYLSDDWYHTMISPGNIFHISDLQNDDIECQYDSEIFPTFPFFHPNNEDQRCIRINSCRGLIVVFPDIFISPTKIADACSCMRRAVISTHIRGLTCKPNISGTLGNLKHQFIETLIQKSLENPKFGTEVSKLIIDTISYHLEELSCANVNDESAYNELQSTVRPVMEWIQKCNSRPKYTGNSCDPSHTPSLIRRTSSNVLYETNWEEIISAEDMIWCPTLGMRGQIDMIVSGSISEPGTTKSSKCIIPVELKTGKWRPEGLAGHRAQLILYLVMIILRDNISWKRNKKQCSGILLYLGTKVNDTKWEVIMPTWGEIRALVQVRNNLAYHISNSSSKSSSSNFPPMLKNKSCESCYHAAECMAYHMSHEKGTEATSGVPTLFQYLTQKLTQSQLTYFTHWEELISLESSLSDSTPLYSLWNSITLNQTDKESRLIVTSVRDSNNDVNNQDFLRMKSESTFYLTFQALNKSSTSYYSSIFHINDVVNVILEKSNKIQDSNSMDIEDIIKSEVNINTIDPFIATGTIYHISEHEIVLSFIELKHRFKRIVFTALENLKYSQSKQLFFRLIREDHNYLSSFSILKSNVLRLLLQSHEPSAYKSILYSNPNQLFNREVFISDTICSRLRDLVIDLVPPTFSSSIFLDNDVSSFFSPKIPSDQHSYLLNELNKYKDVKNTTINISQYEFHSGCFPQELYEEYHKMNIGQQRAIQKVLTTGDYALLLGMPGSGKTSTISFIVRLLVARGQKILITSYTHSAVDNILEKLKYFGLSRDVVGRFGNISSIDDNVKDYLLDPKSFIDVQSFQTALKRFQVIVCTVLTASRSMVINSFGQFDWCIMDECGQISQPAALGPLTLVKKFLLVGDEYQLPPIVLSLEAQARGMNVSLFKRLAEAHPEAVVCLNSQYRMNEEVMSLCNTLIYDNRLRCGSIEVAEGRLYLPKVNDLLLKLANSVFICKPQVEKKSLYSLFRLSNQESLSSPSTSTSLIPSTITLSSHFEWLQKCLDSNNSVIFLDTDLFRPDNNQQVVDQLKSCNEEKINSLILTNNEYSFLEEQNSSSQGIINPLEILLVKLIIDSLEFGGINLSRVGIITPYRSQVRYLENYLKSGNIWNDKHSSQEPSLSNPVISTVDKFQGRDMDVIIISTVRCNLNGSVGDLLRDWRRVNVAITRSRYKLIFIGSLGMMENVEILRELANICRSKNYIIPINPNEFMTDVT